MPKFIKLTDTDKRYSNLNICIDSIERFCRSKIGYMGEEEKDCSHVYMKGHGGFHCVSETPEEIEALINTVS